jgi:hypothetical protein
VKLLAQILIRFSADQTISRFRKLPVPLSFERQLHLTAEVAEDAEEVFGCVRFLRDLRDLCGSILHWMSGLVFLPQGSKELNETVGVLIPSTP